MTPYYDDDGVVIYHGDCREVLPSVRFDAVITSPPYAEQRAGHYDGIAETAYPAFTVEWMAAARVGLAPTGSVLVNIREHIADGVMSDYVLRSRLAVRDAGWCEIDELLWIKPNGPPVGHPDRPRRSWERILWFSPTNRPACYPKANGHASTMIGLGAFGPDSAANVWFGGITDRYREGVARAPDYCVVGTQEHPKGKRPGQPAQPVGHPATYPPKVAAWMARTVTVDGDTIVDPFMGSGSTIVAAKYGGRRAIGIEVEERYCEMAATRFAQGVLDFGGAK